MNIKKSSDTNFDYVKTIKKINKINRSPICSTKENIIYNKTPILNKKQNDPIFNENIPIKVRLMNAAHLNPNINMTQIKNFGKPIKKIDEDINKKEENKSKIINVEKNKFVRLNLMHSLDQKKLKNINTKTYSNNNEENNNITILKYNYNKSNNKPKEIQENIENVDFEQKTYYTNITKTNYSNKKSENKFKDEKEEKKSHKKGLNSEGGYMKKGKGIFSSDNIFSNCNNNYYVDNIGNKDKELNKVYNLNTFLVTNDNNKIKEKINSPINVQTYNNTNSYNITNNNYKYIYLNPKNEKMNQMQNPSDDNIEIKLDDLILFDEKLNDIYIALNTKNIYEDGASDECKEFISFYFHSSLKNNFTYFFNGMNKVIIKSAINLILYMVIISYHLSLNPSYLKKLNRKLKKIFSLSKLNLYLFIKKIQLFYGEKFTKKNDVYFRNFNYILIQNGIYNCNESKIVKMVNKNCYEIVANIDKILDFYKTIENDYYQDFSDIFSLISKINEIDIYNYFNSHLSVNSAIDKPKPKTKSNFDKNKNKKYENYNINTEINDNTLNRPSLPVTRISIDLRDINTIIKNDIKLISKTKNKELENNIILDYEKNRAYPPFLKNKNNKKYTLVLDLEETLIHINQSGECILRPGLYKFLKDIKPYYELVSFSNESKYSSEPIIDIIEEKKKYFDYKLYREHLTFNGKEFIKDISKLGRDIKKVIIVDNIANNFKLNPDNGIQISAFFGDDDEDNALEELKKILILFYRDKYDDLRVGIKKYKTDIIKKITKSNDDDKYI